MNPLKNLIQTSAVLAASISSLHAASLLQSSDFIIAVNPNVSAPNNNPGTGSETAASVIDGTNNKYFNGGGAGSGFVVTPAASSVMQSFVVKTGNDSTWRDPQKYEVYGSNDGGTTWSLISKGGLTTTNDRNTNLPAVSFSNSTAYSSYKVFFPETRYATGQQGFQIAEFSAYTGSGATGSSIFSPADSIVAIDEPVSTSYYNTVGSYYGNYQGPANLLDGNSATKYLNYGAANSGFIVTPTYGATIADGFTITTANDFSSRTPASYQIYGTNSAIVSGDNSYGTAETWTLIQSGSLSLSTSPFITSDVIPLVNSIAYTSYKVIFPSTIGTTETTLQLADFQFTGTIVPEASSFALAGAAFGLLGLRRRRN